ncbi:MAG: GTP 3',8-cyclase MoaA [Bacteroidota bacterium]
MPIDSYGRTLNYARIALTDKCNLRCSYCMPENGLNWLKNQQLFSTQEIFFLLSILKSVGVTKIRFTGGEPTLRSDFKEIVEHAFEIGFEKIALTTNGTYSQELGSWLLNLPWSNINFSIDALKEDLFAAISKRNNFNQVKTNLQQALKSNIPIKLNCVLMDGINDESLHDLVHFVKQNNVEVRFIEEMPFNGSEYRHAEKWSALRIQNELKTILPDLTPLPFLPNSTSQLYSSQLLKGKIGVIAAYTRSFCGTCNRIRITPEGFMKTCLYAPPSLNIKQVIREKRSVNEIAKMIEAICLAKPADGFAAESMHSTENFQSMATVGG